MFLGVLFTLVGVLALPLAGCSPGYVLEAAYRQGKILLAREQIGDLLTDPRTPIEERKKFRLVLDARQFGVALGLTPKRAFTEFSRVDGEAVAWVLSAAKRTEFSFFTWWFPFVGTVPYKGYFEKSDGEAEARVLETKGYETWVRGTSAFSTLGWFNDPLLSTTLRTHPTQIVNTVLHESLHSTIWVPGEVAFNESLANFVGLRGALAFFAARASACSGVDTASADTNNASTDCAEDQKNLQIAERTLIRERELATVVQNLFHALEELYKSSAREEEKLSRRELIFESLVAPLRASYPELKILEKINNAEILQLQLYLQDFGIFEALFRNQNEEWAPFFESMRSIAAHPRLGEKSPFDQLEQLAHPAGAK